jgi:TRAP-type C4-dicarboxylate transport system permease small subunit
MAVTVEDIRRVGQHWLQAVTTALALVAVALLGWTGSQLIAMRDDIHTLKDALPSLEARVTRLETRQDKVIEILGDQVDEARRK